MSTEFHEIDDTLTFKERVREARMPVIVEFRADWCKNCAEVRDLLQSVADDYDGEVELATVNIDRASRLANTFYIADTPTVISFFRGNALQRTEGLPARKELEQMFEYLLALPNVAA